jgi:hypothetical protein
MSACTGTDPPKMTPGRAVLVGLVERYLGGLLDPFISLLEVHKLMYFMQEAGEPLRLHYEKAPFGPYAENFHHVLAVIDGHLVSGYADGGDAPDKQIELVPGATSGAAAFLTGHPETQARFDRVAQLIEGFETPFGMELLATVHWVATREGAAGPAAAVEAVQRWNDRKCAFSARQIELAWDVLVSKGWVPSGAHVACAGTDPSPEDGSGWWCWASTTSMSGPWYDERPQTPPEGYELLGPFAEEQAALAAGLHAIGWGNLANDDAE